MKSEQDLLNPAIRKSIIEEIECGENRARKREAFRRYEQLKDRTYFEVVELLVAQFAPETVRQMQYARSNISITRKVINKLAKVYNNGAIRTVKAPEDKPNDSTEADPKTKAIEETAEYLGLNSVMKKANRYLKLQRNTMLYVKPVKVSADNKWAPCVQALSPFLYDVVPDPANPEKPLAVILSAYTPEKMKYYEVLGDPGVRPTTRAPEVITPGDSVNQTIADTPEDEKGPEHGTFVWWTPNYHFTTNEKGEQITVADQTDNTNPIRMLPFVNLADDQDGAFWAVGGEDLPDGGARINALLTHLNHIAVTQGYGQMVMTGKNLPKIIPVGPNQCIQLEYDKEDPKPEVAFEGANPPLDSMMKTIEAQTALLLTTNNLSTSGFSLSLTDARQFASGIAMMIDKAESIEDTEEQALVFKSAEPKAWVIIFSWTDVLKARGLLVDELSKMPVDATTEVATTFPKPQPIQSESDQLDVLKKRKDLGLNTQLDLIMRDNPGMSKEEAQKKLDEIKKEAQERQAEMGLPVGGQPPKPGEPGAKPGDGNPPPPGQKNDTTPEPDPTGQQ